MKDNRRIFLKIANYLFHFSFASNMYKLAGIESSLVCACVCESLLDLKFGYIYIGHLIKSCFSLTWTEALK